MVSPFPSFLFSFFLSLAQSFPSSFFTPKRLSFHFSRKYIYATKKRKSKKGKERGKKEERKKERKKERKRARPTSVVVRAKRPFNPHGKRFKNREKERERETKDNDSKEKNNNFPSLRKLRNCLSLIRFRSCFRFEKKTSLLCL